MVEKLSVVAEFAELVILIEERASLTYPEAPFNDSIAVLATLAFYILVLMIIITHLNFMQVEKGIRTATCWSVSFPLLQYKIPYLLKTLEKQFN